MIDVTVGFVLGAMVAGIVLGFEIRRLRSELSVCALILALKAAGKL